AETTVRIAILTDGLVDVLTLNGLPAVLEPIGGYVASRLFLGNLTFGTDGAGHLTLTRANGSDLGSFVDEGFEAGQLIRLGGMGAGNDGDYHILTVNATTLTLTTALAGGLGTVNGATISRLTSAGRFD